MATDWLALINNATGGAVTEAAGKLERAEMAMKITLVAAVIAAVTGTLGLIVGLARK
jgi:hypothetical protein